MDAISSTGSLAELKRLESGGRWATPRLYLLLAPLLYALYALITPPFQNFDENQHLYRAWQLSSGQLIGERRAGQSGGELPAGLARATLLEIGSIEPWGTRQVVRRPVTRMFAINTPAPEGGKPIYYNFPGAVVYSPAGYVPQVIAVRVGEASGLSVEWTMRIGRLLNCALCLCLMFWALRLLPFGRWIMLIVALSPPIAAGAASFGQDALVNGGGFLLTALGLKIAVDQRWTRARTAGVALIGGAITLAKLVYLPLVGVALFPVPRAVPARRWISPSLLMGAAIAALTLAWMRASAATVLDPLRPWIPTHSEQVSRAIAHPLDFLMLLGRTWSTLPSIWARLYNFGDSTVHLVWAGAIPGTAALLAVMAYGDEQAPGLTRLRRAWMLAIVAAVTLLTAMVMFVALSMPGAAVIEGIQARYFLPVLPLCAIALMRRGERAPAAVRPTALALVLASNAATLGTLLATFYSF